MIPLVILLMLQGSGQDPAALLDRASKAKNAGKIIDDVMRLKLHPKKPLVAAAWLLELSKRRGGDAHALRGAGYLYLIGKKPKDAIVPLKGAIKLRPTGLSWAYLAGAQRGAGLTADAIRSVREALAHTDAPKKYVEDTGVSLAIALRSTGDMGYAKLLTDLGLSMRAALWSAEDLEFGRGTSKAALALFRKALDAKAPATAYWAGAKIATGKQRFAWLLEAVVRGEDPYSEQDHACPGAVLELARECVKVGRPVVAVALAKRRLAIGPCPAAWEVLESVAPELAR